MSLKSLFTRACKYAAYYNDVLSPIPSQGVKDLLTEKGWRFKETPEAAALMQGPVVPYVYTSLPLETVTTERGTDVYKAGGPDIIHWYESDKKAAAARLYGIKP